MAAPEEKFRYNYMQCKILHKASTIAVVLVVVGFFAYCGALDNFFYGDDFGFISEARGIHLFKPAEFVDGLKAIIQPFWFRVEFVFFFINNLLEAAFGLNPFLYHLHNVLLHITIAGIVSNFVLKLSGSPKISFLSGLLFLLNPLSAEAVYWYTGAHTLYVTLFIALTFWAYGRGFIKTSILFMALAMCSKPDASVLLLYVFLIDNCLYLSSNLRERYFRLRYHILAALLIFIIYGLYYRNAAAWPIPEHRFQFHLGPDSLERLFANFSYLLIPLKRVYFLAVPLLFGLSYLNLSPREKRMLILGAGFIFLSILPYQLFIIDPQGFYFWRYETVRYFYIPAIGQALLAAGVMMILFSRLSRPGRVLTCGCFGILFLLNGSAIVRLDNFFEEMERPYSALVKGVEPYFKEDKSRTQVVFDYPSFADPNLSSFYTSDLPLISEMFFEYKLISVTELKSLPDSSWIKERYARLPDPEKVRLLKFDGTAIKEIPPQDRDRYYQYFIDAARELYHK